MKIYFPLHFDANNRGCEAIAKGTAQILGLSKSQLIGYTRNIELDNQFGLGELYSLIPVIKESFMQKIIRKIKFSLYIKNDSQRIDYVYSKCYDEFLNKISSDDIMFSTGGDMLCYTDNQVNYTNNYISRRNIKTVLWGCSVGKNNLTKSKIDTLRRFSIITVRESITYNLMKELGLNNVYLYPDPAFVLKPQKCVLPDFFSHAKVIGINLSNFVGHDVSGNSLIGKNLYNMISHILSTTDYKILFIPHVLWKGQDDRIVCTEINGLFKDTNRTSILNSEILNYNQIRYIISNCDLFIGARTHAVISAYSTCVPTLALGYSVKSIGIAKDLGLPAQTVIDCLHMENENSLAYAFDYLMENKDLLRSKLKCIIPSYIDHAMKSKDILLNFI